MATVTLRFLVEGLADVNARVDGLAASLSRAGDTALRVGKRLSLGVSLPLAVAGAATLKLASDAEETAAKFDEVFKDSAASVREWAEVQAEATNRSRFAFEEYLSSLQNVLVPLGIARDEAAEMSKRITTLAIDLASFNNQSEPETINALTSAIVGNHEAVRKLGIVITESTLNQELMNRGIEEGTRGATEQEKALARMAVIMRSTADAQGDAVRTADSFANQVKGLKAALEELTVVIGTLIIPHATKIVGVLTDLVRWFSDLPEPVQEAGIVIAAVLGAGGPVLIAIGVFAKALSAILAVSGPLGLFIAAAALAIAAYQNWDEIVAIVKSVVTAVREWLVEKLGAVFDAVKAKVDAVIGFFKGMYDAVVGQSFVPDMVREIEREFAQLDAVMVGPTRNATSGVTDATARMNQNVSRVLRSVRSSFASAFSGIVRGTMTVRDAIRSMAMNILDQLAQLAANKIFDSLFSAALGGASGGASGGAAAAGAAGGFSSLLGGAGLGFAVGGPIGAVIGGISGLIGGLFQTGGSHVVTRPQLIGVGETGPELVRVRPLAGRMSVGDGMTVNVFAENLFGDEISANRGAARLARAIDRERRLREF